MIEFLKLCGFEKYIFTAVLPSRRSIPKKETKRKMKKTKSIKKVGHAAPIPKETSSYANLKLTLQAHLAPINLDALIGS